MIIRLRWIYGWISAAESMMASMEVRCSLLLRILKVYRTEIHSGYIQYTYRGFHIPRRDAGLVITLQGRVLTFQQPVYRRIRCSMLRRRSTSLMYDDRSSMTAGQRVSEIYREEFAGDRGKTTITFLSSAICQRFVFLNLSERHQALDDSSGVIETWKRKMQRQVFYLKDTDPMEWKNRAERYKIDIFVLKVWINKV